MSKICSKNALLCISERCWIIFLNQENKLELWPLNYPPNAISFAASFNRMYISKNKINTHKLQRLNHFTCF